MPCARCGSTKRGTAKVEIRLAGHVIRVVYMCIPCYLIEVHEHEEV